MLSNYFLELKKRVFLFFIAWLICVIICYCYKDILLYILIKSNMTKNQLEIFYFISTNLTDLLWVYLHLSYFISTQLTTVFLLYHVNIFLAPGLFKHEYNKIKYLSFIFLVCFLFSFFLVNFLVLPIIWKFFLTFQNNPNISLPIFFEAKITEYFDFYLTIYYIIFILGQFFGSFFFLLELINKKSQLIVKTRKICYLVFVLLATIVTPPDVISQIFIGLLFIISYEVIILIIFFKQNRI